MAKYYVQSGTLRTTVQADSSRKAALWAVHQAMQQVLPVDDCDDSSPRSKTDSAAATGIRVLDQCVSVSQQGFGCRDTTTMPTMEIVREWNEMFAALDRLQKILGQGVVAA